MNENIQQYDEYLERIKQQYPQYFENTCQLCFKPCCNGDGEYIVVLCKLSETKTNEGRTNISNSLHAKCRGNKFMVNNIFSRTDPSKTINKLTTFSSLPNIMTYKTGEVISHDFGNDLEEVYSDGIQYFNSVISAFYHSRIEDDYTGRWIHYYDNGNKKSEGEYLNGKKNGKWIYYYENGEIEQEGEYLNGQRNGKWNYHFDDADIVIVSEYLNGKRIDKNPS